MAIKVDKQIKVLSLAFLFIFLGYVGVQQHITTFFTEKGLGSLGFTILFIIYLFVAISNPFSAHIIAKIGSKKSMVVSSLFYSMFILSLLTNSVIIIFISSALLGIAGSLLWVGQRCYFLKFSKDHLAGRNAGYFSVLMSLSSILSVFVFSFFVIRYSFDLSFIIFSLFPFAGFILLSFLKETKFSPKNDQLGLFGKYLRNKTILKLATIWFSFTFVIGMAISIIPLNIYHTLGIKYVGGLSSLFYIFPIFFSYSLGKLSDKKGKTLMVFFSYLIISLGLIALYLGNSPFFLVMGIVLLALGSAITNPLTISLLKDIVVTENTESLSALFLMAQQAGVLFAILLFWISQSRIIYLFSVIILFISFIFIVPLFRTHSGFIKVDLEDK
ncbi:MFS transporter [Candidatus Woesearchaeota archaeon]|jgi:MFS family permease|nr:MFS transporter [Candidatus Woesearchaeota archaeon]